MYPLKFEVILKSILWGGSEICKFKNLSTKLDGIGESWEISQVKDNVSVIANGEYKGKNLTELMQEKGAELLGQHVLDRFGDKFPLLIKFIDARDNLSIQVHPNDKLAKERHNSFGKTEMWYVISAQEGAGLYSGFSKQITPDEYVERVENNTIMDVLQFHPVKSGDVFFLPAGRIHAIGKGMDMGIVNPSTSVLYEDIELEFRTLLEDVILARRPEAAEELITYAQNLHVQTSGETPEKHEAWRELSLKERLEHALIKGIGDYLEDDLQEALRIYPHAVDIIDGPLMSGMNKVGELFGAGKMFLPQVVKTARTMKKAVAILQPAIESEKKASGSAKAGKVIFATVKGDVHDIGKNIVSIVLSCNNYEVIDLGVMVPADVIIKKAIEEKPDLVCLSGLITPSLEEMAHVADEMQKAGLTIPMMVGGATTSKLHTAVKIAPHYDYPVIHVLDASQNPLIAAKLLNPDTRDAYIRELEQEQEALRASLGQKKEVLVSLSEARKHPIEIDWTGYTPVVPARMGVHVIPYIPLEEVIPYIHWTFFFSAWKLNGRFSEISQIHGCDSCRASWLAGFPEKDRAKATEAMQLYKDAVRLLDRLVNMKVEYCKAIYGFFSANSEGDTIRMGNTVLPLLRQQAKKEESIYKCLSDYVLPVSEGRTDYVGAFVVTAGAGADELKDEFEREGDTYNSMLLQTLTDRLAEATAEYLHEKVRKEYWGYAKDESLSIPDLYKVKYQGIRPAIGYPSLPDQLLNFTLDGLLDMSRIGVSLTENGAMYPTASVSGIYIAHPSSQYFMIGSIDEEQMRDYASRRNLTEEQVRKLLSRNIG